MGLLRTAAILGATFATLLLFDPPPARAATLEFDLTITYSALPNPNLAPGNLSGTPLFFSDNGVIDHLLTIAVPSPPPVLPVGQTYFASFTPTDPCFGQTSCAISFSFGGSAQGFAAMAFGANDALPNTTNPPPILPIAVLTPGEPCSPGDPCHAFGSIVAFDDPVVIGSWDVTIRQTPLPGALPLFASGLAALGAIGWRRMRRARPIAG